jgi:hypothetical protein
VFISKPKIMVMCVEGSAFAMDYKLGKRSNFWIRNI